ncbi:TPA: lysis protein [Morganella morganii subsp. morganii]|nr:lysis protein [Morganella morganii subsp. morganii]
MMNKIGFSACAIVGLLLLNVGGKWYYDRKIAVLTTTHQTTLNTLTLAAKQQSDAAAERMRTAQRKAAELDARYTGKLKDALEENNHLRDAVRDGARRLRLTGADLATCELSAGRNTGSGSVGDGAEIRLTEKAERTVFDIRAGIISDQAKLDYLQSRVRELEKQCRVSP